MKKAFLIPAIAAGLLLASCKGNEPTPNPDGGKYDEYPYSALTPEQQKEKLAGEADAILEQVRGLQDAKAIPLFQSLINRTAVKDEPTPGEPIMPDYPEAEFFMSKQFRASFWEADKIMVKDVHGTFTWNDEIEDFDYAETPADHLVVVLPSTPESNDLNGRIEVSGTGSGQIVDDEGDQYEIPSTLKVRMYVSNTEAGSIDVSAKDINIGDIDNINWKKLVSQADVTVKVDSYVLKANAAQAADNKVNASASFAKGSDIIVKASLGGAVDWDFVDEYCSWSDWDYETETYICKEYDEERYPMPEEVKAEIEIGTNLAIEGFVNAKALNEELDRLGDKYEYNSTHKWTEEEDRAEAEEYAAAYNKYMRATLASRNDRSKIATLKWGVTTYDRYVTMCNSNGECYEVKEGVGYTFEPFLVFGDNTEITADTYFGSGFEAVINAWEDFLYGFDFE